VGEKKKEEISGSVKAEIFTTRNVCISSTPKARYYILTNVISSPF